MWQLLTCPLFPFQPRLFPTLQESTINYNATEEPAEPWGRITLEFGGAMAESILVQIIGRFWYAQVQGYKIYHLLWIHYLGPQSKECDSIVR